MHNRNQLSQLIEQYINSLEFPSSPDQLYEPIRYSLDGGGKRIRPLVVLMACDVFSGNVVNALPLAAAVEVFHNFTLLHDDIMDNAPLRRGKPAVHVKWSANTAILSGDVMLIYAYKLLAMSTMQNTASLLEEFSCMGAQVCEGQQYDMDFESRDMVSEQEYMKMISLKTAVLIARAAKMGAMIAGASENNCLNMYHFGHELGLAFQLQDDLLDSYGTDLAFGKKVGGDIVEGKKSFLTVTAMANGNTQQRNELSASLSDWEMPDVEKIECVRAIYDAMNIMQITQERIKKHIILALKSLNKVDVAVDRLEPLRELAISMLNRKK